ncbi:MAG: 16S rRNA (uracil(1498)-N(3))-methyltransferase [Planctomycetes bacterium]|nr:16S rRNA (uracil(1498)-N(3))-methyltransferase [Planctomycetota bacterium]
MRRFHHKDLPSAGSFTLDGEEGTHLTRVLRARPGDEVLVFDGAGREALCRVVDARKDVALLDVVAATSPRRPTRDITLCTAAPKGDRMEWLIEKCVEAGVSSIVPWAAERSVRDRAGEGTLRRWRRSALEACKQCGRADLPTVFDVLPLADALVSAGVVDRALCVATPGCPDMVEAVAGPADAVQAIAIVIGPEGGFTPGETGLLGAAGARPFGLGPMVLRIETAAVIAVHRAAF